MRSTIEAAQNARDIEDARTLFREHIGYIGDDRAYIGLEVELAALPGNYSPPGGNLFLCRQADGQPIGCIAVRVLNAPDTCELKHLYVRDKARGQGLGRRLVEAVIEFAAQAGYQEILLSTLPSLTAANQIYLKLGFHQTSAFYDEPMTEAIYFSKTLTACRL